MTHPQIAAEKYLVLGIAPRLAHHFVQCEPQMPGTTPLRHKNQSSVENQHSIHHLQSIGVSEMKTCSWGKKKLFLGSYQRLTLFTTARSKSVDLYGILGVVDPGFNDFRAGRPQRNDVPTGDSRNSSKSQQLLGIHHFEVFGNTSNKLISPLSLLA